MKEGIFAMAKWLMASDLESEDQWFNPALISLQS